MTSHQAQLQALIAEIESLLAKATPKLPWVMSGEANQQRRVLEQVLSYLRQMQSQAETSASQWAVMSRQGAIAPPAPYPTEPEAATEANSQQILQALLQEMQYLRAQMIQPLTNEVMALQQQREHLKNELRQLEQARLQGSAPSPPNETWMQEVVEQLRTALLDQLTPQLKALQRQIDNPAALYGSEPEALAGAADLPPLTPQQRLAYLRQIQVQTDHLLLQLDANLRAVFDSMEQSIQSYCDSLNQGLGAMHGLGQQGEVIFRAFINHLAQQLRQESGYRSGTDLSSADDSVAWLLRGDEQTSTSQGRALSDETDWDLDNTGLDSGVASDGVNFDDIDEEEVTLFQLDEEITQLPLEDADEVDAWELEQEADDDEERTVVQMEPIAWETVTGHSPSASDSPDPDVASPETGTTEAVAYAEEIDALYASLFGETGAASPEAAQTEEGVAEAAEPVDSSRARTDAETTSEETDEETVVADLLGLESSSVEEAAAVEAAPPPSGSAFSDVESVSPPRQPDQADVDLTDLLGESADPLAVVPETADSEADDESEHPLSPLLEAATAEALTPTLPPDDAPETITSLADLLPSPDSGTSTPVADPFVDLEDPEAGDVFIPAPADEDLLTPQAPESPWEVDLSLDEEALDQLTADLSRLEGLPQEALEVDTDWPSETATEIQPSSTANATTGAADDRLATGNSNTPEDSSTEASQAAPGAESSTTEAATTDSDITRLELNTDSAPDDVELPISFDADTTSTEAVSISEEALASLADDLDTATMPAGAGEAASGDTIAFGESTSTEPLAGDDASLAGLFDTDEPSTSSMASDAGPTEDAGEQTTGTADFTLDTTDLFGSSPASSDQAASLSLNAFDGPELPAETTSPGPERRSPESLAEDIPAEEVSLAPVEMAETGFEELLEVPADESDALLSEMTAETAGEQFNNDVAQTASPPQDSPSQGESGVVRPEIAEEEDRSNFSLSPEGTLERTAETAVDLFDDLTTEASPPETDPETDSVEDWLNDWPEADSPAAEGAAETAADLFEELPDADSAADESSNAEKSGATTDALEDWFAESLAGDDPGAADSSVPDLTAETAGGWFEDLPELSAEEDDSAQSETAGELFDDFAQTAPPDSPPASEPWGTEAEPGEDGGGDLPATDTTHLHQEASAPPELTAETAADLFEELPDADSAADESSNAEERGATTDTLEDWFAESLAGDDPDAADSSVPDLTAETAGGWFEDLPELPAEEGDLARSETAGELFDDFAQTASPLEDSLRQRQHEAAETATGQEEGDAAWEGEGARDETALSRSLTPETDDFTLSLENISLELALPETARDATTAEAVDGTIETHSELDAGLADEEAHPASRPAAASDEAAAADAIADETDEMAELGDFSLSLEDVSLNLEILEAEQTADDDPLEDAEIADADFLPEPLTAPGDDPSAVTDETLAEFPSLGEIELNLSLDTDTPDVSQEISAPEESQVKTDRDDPAVSSVEQRPTVDAEAAAPDQSAAEGAIRPMHPAQGLSVQPTDDQSVEVIPDETRVDDTLQQALTRLDTAEVGHDPPSAPSQTDVPPSDSQLPLAGSHEAGFTLAEPDASLPLAATELFANLPQAPDIADPPSPSSRETGASWQSESLSPAGAEAPNPPSFSPTIDPAMLFSPQALPFSDQGAKTAEQHLSTMPAWNPAALEEPAVTAGPQSPDTDLPAASGLEVIGSPQQGFQLAPDSETLPPPLLQIPGIRDSDWAVTDSELDTSPEEALSNEALAQLFPPTAAPPAPPPTSSAPTDARPQGDEVTPAPEPQPEAWPSEAELASLFEDLPEDFAFEDLSEAGQADTTSSAAESGPHEDDLDFSDADLLALGEAASTLLAEEGPGAAIPPAEATAADWDPLEAAFEETDAAIARTPDPSPQAPSPPEAARVPPSEPEARVPDEPSAAASSALTAPEPADAGQTPPPTAALDPSPEEWFLGIDLGTNGLSAVLMNRVNGAAYPLYWTGTTLPDEPEATFRLPAIATFQQTAATSDWQLQAVGQAPLFPPSTAANPLLLNNALKPLLKVGMPHQSAPEQWQPHVQWSEHQTLSLHQVWLAVQALLSQVHPASRSGLAGVGLEQATLIRAFETLQGVIIGHPSHWPDTYCLNVREAVLAAQLVTSPNQVFLVEEAIAAVLSGLPDPSASVEASEPPAHTLYQCQWQGGTVVISAGATCTEVGIAALPHPLDALSRDDFTLRNLAYGGDALDLDIICQLLIPPERRQPRPSHDRQSTSQAGWHWSPALPEVMQTRWDSLALETLELPQLAEPDLRTRIRLRQHLESSALGQSLLEAARYLKLILQHQGQCQLDLADQRWRVLRRDLESRILVPYIQRLNQHLNALLSTTGLAAQGINQVICTGGTASFAAIAKWLRQKFPNATIIQDTYPSNRPPSCSRVAYGLVNLCRYPQLLDVPRHQYSDYFLLSELLRSLPDQPLPLNGILHLLEEQGINVTACRSRILAILEGHLPPGLVPDKAAQAYLSATTLAREGYQVLSGHALFSRQSRQIYMLNPQQRQRLRTYLETVLADKQQSLAEPLIAQLVMP